MMGFNTILYKMSYKLFQIFFICLFISLPSCSAFKADPYQCKICLGKGYIHRDCRVCHSTGIIYCPYCSNGQKTCFVCNGRGYTKICHTCDNGYIKCSFCNNGHIVHKKADGTTITNTCRTCGGSYRKVCPSCKGKYIQHCYSCRGSGIKTCQVCNGLYQQSCHICFGKTDFCSSCNGTGRIDTIMTSKQ